MDTEPQVQRDSMWTFYIVLFSLITLLALWANLSGIRLSGGPGKTPERDRTDSLLKGDASAKIALALPLPRASPDEQAQYAVKHYRDALPWPAAYRRLGIAKQVLLNKNGLAELEMVASKKATRGLDATAVRRLADEAGMWRTIYSGARLTRSQVREFIPRVRRLNLGPLKQAAVAEVYAGAGMAKEANAALDRARTTAAVQRMGVLLLFVLAFAAGGVGFFLAWAFLARSAGLLREAQPLTARPGVLFGGFTTYLVFTVLLSAAAVATGKTAVSQMAGQIVVSAVAFFIGFDVLSRQARRAGSEPREIGLRGEGWGWAIKWGVGGYCAALPVMFLALGISLALQNAFLRDVRTPEHPIVSDLLSGGLATLLAYVVAVVVAPVIEEVFFRGALYTGLRARMGVWGAALFCGVMFASMHPLPGGFLPLLGLSVVLSLLRERTGSVYPGMVCHALNNALMLTLVLLIY